MKKYSLSDLNDYQLEAIRVLCDIGGWATSGQLKYHGVNHASAEALHVRGFAERRTVLNSHYGVSEWRMNLTRLGECVDFIEEGSVYQKLISSYHREFLLKTNIHNLTANAILDSIDNTTTH
jgi:hypothetical protein